MSSNVQVQPPKGSRDFLPIDIRHREYATQIIRQVYETYGFEPLQTPTFERLQTLLGKYGEEGDQLLFKVLLRGQPLLEGINKAYKFLQEPGAVVHGRSGQTVPKAEPLLADLGLRYDQTVPLARVYAAYQNRLPSIFRCYQIQPVWRADTPGKGRFREFYQCDVDMVGASSKLAEVEVLSAACECLHRLGFDSFKVRINHRLLLKAIIEVSGIPPHLETDAIVAIDKIDKIGVDGVEDELANKSIDKMARNQLLSMVEEKTELAHIQNKISDHELGVQAVEDIRTIFELCNLTAAANRLSFDISLARGLDYYTGTIFETSVPHLRTSLGGGGRYDNLIGMFMGKRVPACGFSLGLERILYVMEERGMFPETMHHLDIIVAVVQMSDLPMALQLCSTLRSAGYRVELIPKAMKPGKLRKVVDQRKVPFALWLEPDAKAHASIWSKKTGTVQTDLSVDQVLQNLPKKT